MKDSQQKPGTVGSINTNWNNNTKGNSSIIQESVMEASSDETKSHQTRLDNDIELLEKLFEKV